MIHRSSIILCLAGWVYGTACCAQTSSDHEPSPHFSKAIEDNSFFVEEAFNQEDGVVQHISTWTLFSTPSKEALYTFTQEWPLWGFRNQFSYTVLHQSVNPSGTSGLGDMLVTYRYQLFTAGDWAAVSPRFSLIVPTGNRDQGLGWGTAGFQIALPVSKRLSENFIAHMNILGTFHPGVTHVTATGKEVKHSLTGFAFGGSVLWLAADFLNIMLELMSESSSSIDARGNVVHETGAVVSPGVRFAIDIGELQIVPGVGVPLRFREGGQDTGVFLYLSFEHPF